MLACYNPYWLTKVYAPRARSHFVPLSRNMAAVANPESGLDADERIAIVDESNNEVVGSARRAEMVSVRMRGSGR